MKKLVNPQLKKKLVDRQLETRRSTPIEGIKWTNGDLENLDIYFGAENLAIKTFQKKIVPKFKRKLTYWQQFTLIKIGKARVVEMFLASKLVYAVKFYPIPDRFKTEIQNAIFNYVNFLNKVKTIGQKETFSQQKNHQNRPATAGES